MLHGHRRAGDGTHRFSAGGAVPARHAGQLLQPREVRHPAGDDGRSAISRAPTACWNSSTFVAIVIGTSFGTLLYELLAGRAATHGR